MMDGMDDPVTEEELARIWELTPEREYIETISGGYFAWAAGARAARYDLDTCSTEPEEA